MENSDSDSMLSSAVQPPASNSALQRIASAPPAPAGMFGAVDIQALLEKATTAEAGVEVLERLAVMRREMKAEHAKEAFDQAMANFQAECPTIKKDAEVRGQKFSYNYAPLDSIVNQTKALIQKHGFSYRVTAKVEGTNVTAICKVIHSLGHAEESEFQVPIDPTAHMNQAQKFASALTFAKRYAFCNAFGILTGDSDDDAGATDPDNAAGQDRRPPTRAPTQPPPATQTATEKRPSNPERYPNEAYRNKAIAEIVGNDLESPDRKKLLHEFLIKAGCLLATEPLESWPFQYVPASKENMAELRAALVRFENGEEAKIPYHHGADPATLEKGTRPPKAKSEDKTNAIEVPRNGVADGNAWRDFIIPFGNFKDQRLEDIPKRSLFGFWANFTVETEFKGRPMPAEKVAKDKAFREALDAAGLHYKFEVKS